MSLPWSDPTGAAVTIYSVDGQDGVMTLDNVDASGTQLLTGLDVAECEITFAMDWVSGASGTISPVVYYRAASDVSTFYKAMFDINLDPLTQDEIVGITIEDENGIIASETVSKIHTPGVAHRVKIRSTQNHFVKVWDENVAEPAGWDLIGGGGSNAHGTVGLSASSALDDPAPASLDTLFLLGFEAATISGAGVGAVPLVSVVSGSVLMSTAGQGRDGVGYCGIFSAPGSGAASLTPSSSTASTDLSVVAYVKFINTPSADTGVLQVTGLPQTMYIYWESTNGRLTARPQNSGAEQSGPVVTTGVWYRIDLGVDARTSPATMVWSVDGVAQPTASTGVITAPDTLTASFGHPGSSIANSLFTYHMDDLAIVNGVINYPLGETKILGLTATATVTEVGTANSMCRFTGNGSSLDVTFNAADILAAIQTNVIGATATGVYQRVIGAGDFVRIPMSTYALGIGEGILSVRAEMIGWAGSSTANNVSLLGNVGGSNDTLFALADPALDNSLTGCWLAPMYNASGGWTQAKLDALAFIFGGGTDVSPTPGINFAFAEVAVRTDDSPAAASIDVKFDDLQILSCVED